MRTFLVALALGTSSIAITAQAPQAPAATPPAAHVTLVPGDLKWAQAPTSVPGGAQIAVLSGDPAQPGPFVMRLKFPDGYKVPAHWHPTDEHLTVLQGTFRIGMGDTYSEAGLKEFPAGSFVKMPKEMRHFAGAKGETIVQLHAEGPFRLIYVNPSDDPSKKTTPSR
jgi:quercetin dioxygenase-like cupin family protein